MLLSPVVQITDGVWLISSFKLVNSYLIVGQKKALLIDTGCGAGNIQQTVNSLTNRHLAVAITHGHFDHDAGGGLFDSVYMNEADWPVSRDYERQGSKILKDYILSRGEVRNPGQGEALAKMVLENLPKTFTPLSNGQLFDLGGRVIETIFTPGHTVGSVCFLDSKSKILFTGDMCNHESLLLNFDHSTTVSQYNASMKHLWARNKEFKTVGIGHGTLQVYPKSIISDYIKITDKILSGGASPNVVKEGIHRGLAYEEKGLRIFYSQEKIN